MRKPDKCEAMTLSNDEFGHHLLIEVSCVNILAMKKIRSNITPLEDKLIRKLINKLKTKEGVVALILYGSRASGLSNEDSDLDLALITEKSLPYNELNSIKNEINEEMSIVGELRIDIFNFTEDEIRHLPVGKEIREKGLLLWKKNRNLQKVL